MKLLRLDLRAYAQFSQLLLNFNPNKKIQIVFGQNEAGKSSLTRALKSLYFGFDKHNEDAYLHTLEKLFIEGLIQTQDGKHVQILREYEKKRKSSLKLQDFYPNWDKQIILNTFFLNQESLRIGSKDLLENIKHFDVSLFSSIRGTIKLLNTLKSLEIELENLYKPKGTKPLINQKLVTCKNLKIDNQKLLLTEDQWTEIDSASKKIKLEITQLSQNLQKSQQEVAQLETLKDAYPTLSKYNQVLKDLKKYNKFELIDHTKLNQILKVLKEKRQLKTISLNLQREISEIDSSLHKIAYDEILYKKGNELENSNIQPDYYFENFKKLKDSSNELQVLKAEFKKINLDLQNLIKSSISKNEWKKVRVTALGLIDYLKTGNKIVAHAEEQIHQCISQIEQLSKTQLNEVDANDVNMGQELLKQLKSYNQQCKQINDAKYQLKINLKELNLKSILNSNITFSSIESLNANAPSTFDNFLHNYIEMQSRFIEKMKELNQLNVDIQKSRSKSNANSSLKSDVISKFLDARKDRQSLSKNLTKNWDSNDQKSNYQLFLNYIQMIEKEDEHIDKIFENIDEWYYDLLTVNNLERKRLLELSLNEYEQSLKELLVNLEEYLSINNIFNFKFCLEKSGIDELSLILKSIVRMNTQIYELKKTESIIEELKFAVISYLKIDGKNLTLEELLYHLTARLKQYEYEKIQFDNIKQQIETLKSTILFLEKSIKHEQLHKKKIISKWDKIKDQFQIQVNFSEKSLGSFIDKLDNFFIVSDQIKFKTEEIKELIKIKIQYEKFYQNIFGFTEINPDTVTDIHLRIKKNFLQKIEHDKYCFLKSEKLSDILKNLEQLNDIDTAFDSLKMELSTNFSTYTEESIEEYIELVKSQSQLKTQLELKCKPHSIQLYQEKLKGFASLELIDIALTNNKSISSKLSNHMDELQNKLGELNYRGNEVVNFQNKFNIQKKLQSEIFDLENYVQQYLILKTASTYIRNVIWDYQQKNQENILSKATVYFEFLTNRKYHKIGLNLLENQESSLYCISEKDQFVTVSSLSEGTRDQLFLALKLAFIDLYTEKNESLPIILDDILVNFDDVRSIAFIKLLEKISEKSQVIFLTHHSHLLDLFSKNMSPQSYDVISLSADLVSA